MTTEIENHKRIATEPVPAGFNLRMKPLLLTLALLGMVAAATQKSDAETVVHTRTVVHTNYNWDHGYWHSHKYGYWHGHRGYWHVVHGDHVFVVVE